MEIYRYWDRGQRKLSLEMYIGDRLFQPVIRLLPACPHCHGEGGYSGSYDPPEPPEECGYCEDEMAVSYWRWLRYQVGALIWDSRLGEWLINLRQWQDEPASEYEDLLDMIYWRQFDKSA
jgi:hypothetical protein